MITVLFFAGLREAVGTSSETLALPSGVTTVAALRDHLAARGDKWIALNSAKNLRAAVNQDMVLLTAEIKDGDEIAFFPPVTGG
ncbi:MAG TPA: molybdopterin converting factor subunit 1 [Rhodocyclaceae bacterium]|nr:molybdopterin converting factor subunit 1 [Rhodocyclaceae bacterium]